MMYKPLTESLGEELLKLYLGDFHAKTSVQPGGGAGITGERSSMWKHMARIIGEVQPRYCFVENSPMLTNRGLGTVLGDLASMGFDAEWGVLSAADIGAKHQRERVWVLGNSNGIRLERNTSRNQLCSKKKTISRFNGWDGSWNNLPKPYYIRSSDGVADRVDRLKAIGNGQVPLCAATAWRLLKERLDGQR
jgi:DNA (cytosine-5)-methyltransferase 1